MPLCTEAKGHYSQLTTNASGAEGMGTDGTLPVHRQLLPLVSRPWSPVGTNKLTTDHPSTSYSSGANFCFLYPRHGFLLDTNQFIDILCFLYRYHQGRGQDFERGRLLKNPGFSRSISKIFPKRRVVRLPRATPLATPKVSDGTTTFSIDKIPFYHQVMEYRRTATT
jgi:hypothetical protein